jgi:hypothetical protein
MELIRRYFQLAPGPYREAYFAQFADDAVVEDEGRIRRGIEAIRAWRGEVPAVTYTVREVVPAGEGHDAHVDVAGDFPGSPVRLRFHFVFTGGRIALLTIRP